MELKQEVGVWLSVERYNGLAWAEALAAALPNGTLLYLVNHPKVFSVFVPGDTTLATIEQIARVFYGDAMQYHSDILATEEGVLLEPFRTVAEAGLRHGARLFPVLKVAT